MKDVTGHNMYKYKNIYRMKKSPYMEILEPSLFLSRLPSFKILFGASKAPDI